MQLPLMQDLDDSFSHQVTEGRQSRPTLLALGLRGFFCFLYNLHIHICAVLFPFAFALQPAKQGDITTQDKAYICWRST